MIQRLKIILSIMVVSIAMRTSAIDSNSSETRGISPYTYLFSHGIADTHKQAYRWYAKKSPVLSYPESDRYIINNEEYTLLTFDYPDAVSSSSKLVYPKIEKMSDLLNIVQHIQTFSYRVDRYNSSLAGKNELELLLSKHAEIGDCPVIGIGVSRGASAFITLLGLHYDKPEIQNIKALVLESPFDSMDSILRNAIGETLYQYDVARTIGHAILKFLFAQYDKAFITPLESVANIPQDLPIMIICSEEDALVPAWSSEKLYTALKDTGHTNVHCLTLKRGLHGKLMQGSEGETYRNAVHAFYQHYNLPHNPEYAELGKETLKSVRQL